MLNWENKKVHLVVGLMSGTSVDGIDAALVHIGGEAEHPDVRLLAFENTSYPSGVREKLFQQFNLETSTVKQIGYLNFLLGELYSCAALSVIDKSSIKRESVDLIASHGQTIWHEPEPCNEDGFPVRYTVQIGEGAVIAARTGIPTVTDFRVADMAVGGHGAPLVPFSEYLLYRKQNETILLQNIGGIGNMTVLPAGTGPDTVFAFDTGPGNMIIDAVVKARTGGLHSYDKDGLLGSAGTVNHDLLALMKQDPYYRLPPPKTTGRELFGEQYTRRILEEAKDMSLEDLVATVTDLTAWSIEDAYCHFVLPVHKASQLVVGGGGTYNHTLISFLRRRFKELGVSVRLQEDLGWSSDAKEAVAFAMMGAQFASGLPNVLPSVTGANCNAVMGKLSLPPYM